MEDDKPGKGKKKPQAKVEDDKDTPEEDRHKIVNIMDSVGIKGFIAKYSDAEVQARPDDVAKEMIKKSAKKKSEKEQKSGSKVLAKTAKHLLT